MKISFILILFFITINNSFGQRDSAFSVEQIENLFDDEQLDSEDSQLYDLFEYLIDNPVDLNSADRETLLTIPTIDLRIADTLIEWRDRHGLFRSIYDLNKIESFTEEDIYKLLPFVSVSRINRQVTDLNIFNDIIKNSSVRLRSRTLSDVQERKGFIENKFSGSKFKYYNRLQIKSGNYFSAGILLEKDAGENSLDDFNSYYLQVNELGVLKNFVAGDFLIEFGQGLAMWSPYAFSKGSDAVSSLNKRGRDIRPYTSSDENQFFRGFASSLIFGELKLTAFYSKNIIDANIDSLSNLILSRPLDGYHRTESELNKKKRTTETSSGIITHYSLGNFLKLGAMFYRSEFSNIFSPSEVFDIEGSVFNFYSLSYSAHYEKLAMSGEFAYNGISVASVNRIQINFSRNFIFSTLVRSYPRNYINLHSNGFGESSGTQNEFGIYTGFRWRTPIGLFNIYYDQFKFPYATYYNPVPSAGNEFLINYELKPFDKTTLLLKYKNENKETAAIIENEKELVEQVKQNIRFEVRYRTSKKLQLRTRIELMYYDLGSLESENGFLAFQDVKYSPAVNLRIYGRIVFFQTDSYNSRIYEFENDLTGLMTNPALFGKGIKWYLLVNYKPANYISISVKYSELYKPDERTIGSGLGEIKGNLDNKLSLQIDIFL